jgi:hypothetical protein
MVEYVNVKIPVSFRDRFEKLNKEHDLGYSSFAEIIKECLRSRLEDIENTYSVRTKDP